MHFLRLECPVQHYDWGERRNGGKSPFIADFLGEEPGDKPWAELWMGAHPAASSRVVESGGQLCQAIDQCPEKMLGHKGCLSFLLKILCCSRPLSIQSHPDKATAVRLHEAFPDEFPDDNHKPEVLWALSPFRVLAGFRPLDEAIFCLEKKKSLSGWAELLRGKGAYSELCSLILGMDAAGTTALTKDLALELDKSNEIDALFAEIAESNPADSGAFFAFLLNYIRLEPGQAVFVPANTPHAYLEGRGVECMACSDNVIRAGLTHKTKRKDLLMETLDFSPASPEKMLAVNDSGNCLALDHSPDFRLSIVRDGDDFSFKERTPAIICVLSGNARLSCGDCTVDAKGGDVFFKPAAMEDAALKAMGKGVLLAVAEE